MRVISGIAKGRRLTAPKGSRTRPTADRVKESLFSIVANRIVGAVVLDLYAGSGALAIEALSRGAESAYLVDKHTMAIGAINRNLALTGFDEKAVVVRAPVTQALNKLIRRNQTFDLIFLDPPYKIDNAELEVVLEKTAGCLSKEGLVILEHGPDFSANNKTRPKVSGTRRRITPRMGFLAAFLVLVDERRYGDCELSFYERGNRGNPRHDT